MSACSNNGGCGCLEGTRTDGERMRITSCSFRETGQYRELKQQYSVEELKSYENNEVKIQAFYEKVLPSLAVQVVLGGKEGPMPRYVCLFEACLSRKLQSFIRKHNFLRHLQSYHSSELPNGGSFLFNPITTKIFRCDVCNVCYVHQLDYNNHCECAIHQRRIILTKFNPIVLTAIMWHKEWHTEQTLRCATVENHLILEQAYSVDDANQDIDKKQTAVDIDVMTKIREEKKLIKRVSSIKLDSKPEQTQEKDCSSLKRELSSTSICGNVDKKIKNNETDSDLDFMN